MATVRRPQQTRKTPEGHAAEDVVRMSTTDKSCYWKKQVLS